MTVGVVSVAGAVTGSGPLLVGVATGAVVSSLRTLLLAAGPGPSAAAVGVSSSAGAIIAALTSKSIAGGGIGAVGGGTVSAMGAWIAGIAGGPLGGMILGTKKIQHSDGLEDTEKGSEICYTFDCWKPILREQDSNISDGMRLRDVLSDCRVIQVTFLEGNKNVDGSIPQILVRNKWEEEFLIEFKEASSGLLISHATPV